MNDRVVASSGRPGELSTSWTMGGASVGVIAAVALRCSLLFSSSQDAHGLPEPPQAHFRFTAVGAGWGMTALRPCITRFAMASASTSRGSLTAPMASLRCTGSNGRERADARSFLRPVISPDASDGIAETDRGRAVPPRGAASRREDELPAATEGRGRSPAGCLSGLVEARIGRDLVVKI